MRHAAATISIQFPDGWIIYINSLLKHTEVLQEKKTKRLNRRRAIAVFSIAIHRHSEITKKTGKISEILATIRKNFILTRKADLGSEGFSKQLYCLYFRLFPYCHPYTNHVVTVCSFSAVIYIHIGRVNTWIFLEQSFFFSVFKKLCSHNMLRHWDDTNVYIILHFSIKLRSNAMKNVLRRSTENRGCTYTYYTTRRRWVGWWNFQSETALKKKNNKISHTQTKYKTTRTHTHTLF